MRALSSKRGRRMTGGFLEGQLLIAMPTMTDKRFQRSVIFMCAHSAEGAMGLIINQRAEHITFPSLLKQLKIIEAAGEEAVPPDMLSMAVHVGGPVQTERGFVLHTSDYTADDATMRIDASVCLTATVDILRAMATGEGPDRAILALGYAGWSAGQLENEIQANGWLHCAADPDLVFDRALENKYDRALSKLGIDLSHLVSDCGHA